MEILLFSFSTSIGNLAHNSDQSDSTELSEKDSVANRKRSSTHEHLDELSSGLARMNARTHYWY